MSTRTLGLDDALLAYLRRVGLREARVLAALREETASHPLARMQISPEQGALMRLLVELVGARTCLEIGTFTGYSALAVALSLPADGRLVTLDVSAEHTARARAAFEAAGVAHKIELRLGDARDTLAAMIAAGEAGRYDFAFVDADKTGYAAYVEACHTLLRPGGLLALDNVLWSGRVIDPSDRSADTEALRAVNEGLAGDHRFTLAMVPVGDGLTLLRKR